MVQNKKISLEAIRVRSFTTSLDGTGSTALKGGTQTTISLQPGINCNTGTGGGGVSDASQCCPLYND